METMLKENANITNLFAENLQTPLHLACEYNRATAAEILLKYGALQTLRNNDSEIPLHICTKRFLFIRLKD
jgi:ankyrin repeat protein